MVRTEHLRVDCQSTLKQWFGFSKGALENRLVLARRATEEKSNEITAIPKLLRQ
jgi:hypothetical protein